MSKIISIGTAVPAFEHEQKNILGFMKRVYAPGETERRKMDVLYARSGINKRYSVLSDYGEIPENWTFYPPTENLEPFPSIEERMRRFNLFAPETIGNRYTQLS